MSFGVCRRCFYCHMCVKMRVFGAVCTHDVCRVCSKQGAHAYRFINLKNMFSWEIWFCGCSTCNSFQKSLRWKGADVLHPHPRLNGDKNPTTTDRGKELSLVISSCTLYQLVKYANEVNNFHENATLAADHVSLGNRRSKYILSVGCILVN